VLEFFHWLQNTQWAVALRQSDFFFPVVEGTHILALSISVGMLFMFDLRLLGLAFRRQPAGLVMKEVMKWAMPGFALMFLTGILLFLCQAEKVYTNTNFRLKFLLMFLAGLNALFYQVKYYPRTAEWDKLQYIPAGVRTTAILSLILWAGVITFGRTMAYEL
jgi:hypothetical protein